VNCATVANRKVYAFAVVNLRNKSQAVGVISAAIATEFMIPPDNGTDTKPALQISSALDAANRVKGITAATTQTHLICEGETSEKRGQYEQ
jgi:hypothetical protein